MGTSAPRKGKPRIAIAVLGYDPLRLVGLRAIFEAEPEFSIHEIDLKRLNQSASSDVVLLGAYDVPSVYETVAALRGLRRDARIILSSPSSSEDTMLRALSSGVRGYLDEAAPPEVYKQAIRVVYSGSMWMPRRVMAKFIEHVTATPSKSTLEYSAHLSYREKQVLELLVIGRTNREIGVELGIQERSVKAHITRLMQKAGVANRTALSVHALNNLLINAPRD